MPAHRLKQRCCDACWMTRFAWLTDPAAPNWRYEISLNRFVSLSHLFLSSVTAILESEFSISDSSEREVRQARQSYRVRQTFNEARREKDEGEVSVDVHEPAGCTATH